MKRFTNIFLALFLCAISDAVVTASYIDTQTDLREIAIQAGFFDPNATLYSTDFSYYSTKKVAENIELYHDVSYSTPIITLNQQHIAYLKNLLVQAKQRVYDTSQGPLAITVDDTSGGQPKYKIVLIDVQGKYYLTSEYGYYFVLNEFTRYPKTCAKNYEIGNAIFWNTYGERKDKEKKIDNLTVYPEYNNTSALQIDVNKQGTDGKSLRTKLGEMIEANRKRENLQKAIVKIGTTDSAGAEKPFTDKLRKVQGFMYQNVEIAEQDALAKAADEYVTAGAQESSEKYRALKSIIDTIAPKYDPQNAKGAIEGIDFVTHIHNQDRYTYRVTFVYHVDTDKKIQIYMIPVYLYKNS